ncbi:hypothetical protein [Lysobacter gummosus]
MSPMSAASLIARPKSHSLPLTIIVLLIGIFMLSLSMEGRVPG